jgi:hypothetical protein
MTLERAKEINQLMCKAYMFSKLDLNDGSFPEEELKKLTLSEMIMAGKIITENGGKYNGVTCDDRLVAAIYTLLWFYPDEEAIAHNGTIGVFVLNPQNSEDDE